MATLLALFHNDQTVAAAAAAEAIRPLTIDDLIDAGLIEAVGAGVRSRMKLLGFEACSSRETRSETARTRTTS